MTTERFSAPPIIIGAWQLSDGHHHRRGLTSDEALEVFLGLIERGIATFDCADIYTGVEELLGRVRREAHARLGARAAESIRVHTKFVPDRSSLGEVDRPYVERIVDRSLRRLGSERLDLVQFAWWDYAIPGYVETAQVLADLQREGKIAHVGATNFDVPRLAEILDAGVPLVAHQVQYSLLDHRPEHGMTDLARERGFGLFCYGALAGGFLSHRWLNQPDPAPGGLDQLRALSNRSLTKYRLIIEEFGGWDRYQELLRAMAVIAKRREATLAQVALRYVLDRPGSPSVILGVSRAERMTEALGALDLRLDERDRSELRELLGPERGPGGDCFGLERDPENDHAAIMKYDLNSE